MAETKKYLDLVGLSHYDEKIKGVIDAKDSATLQSAKDYTDGKIGTLADTTKDVANNIATVAAAVVGEKNRAEGVEGTLTSLTTDAKGNLVAAINEVDAHADAANNAIGSDDTAGTVKGRIKALETAVGEGGSVSNQIDAKINALDATVYGSMTADGAVREGQKVGVKVVETDGKLTEVVVATQDIASANALGKLQAVVGENELAEGAKSHKERLETLEGLAGNTSVASQINAALDAVVGYHEVTDDNKQINARLDVLEGDYTVEGSVDKALFDAKAYADTLDTAMDARVDKLEATHSTVTKEGVTRLATVQEEAAAEVAKVVADAPEAFDTLKEIAEWIQKEGESGFDAAARIEALETKTTGIVVNEGEAVTVANAIAKAKADEASRIDAIVGTPDSGKTIQGEIDAVEASIATLNGSATTAGSVAKAVADEASRIDAIVGTPDSGKTIQAEIDDLESVIGTDATANTVKGRIKAIEDELAGADIFTSITNSEIDSLFGE